MKIVIKDNVLHKVFYEQQFEEEGIADKYENIITVDDADVVVPEGIESIHSEVFMEKDTLRSIVLPDSLRQIGAFAFWGCENLEDIVISKKIDEIGLGAFRGCQKVTVEKGNPYYFMEHGMLMEKKGDSKRLVWVPEDIEIAWIPDTVTEIDRGVFSGNCNLKSVHLPNDMESVHMHQFEDCYSLNRVFLPKNLKKVSNSAFANCESLKAIVMENPLTYFEQEFSDSLGDAFQNVEGAFVFSEENPWMEPYLDMHAFARRDIELSEFLYKKDFEDSDSREVEIEEFLMQIEGVDAVCEDVRPYKCLMNAGICTLGDLMGITEEQLRKIRNMNDRCVDQILNGMKELGIELKK